MSYHNFKKALEILYPSEGGYVNDKYDHGGATNMGVTQKTYNRYRQQKNLPLKDVRNITNEEATDLYYQNYWLPSGADEITDSNLAVTIFDTAVLHGPETARKFYKQSNGNIDKYLNIRQNS